MQEQITAVQQLLNTLIEFSVNYSFQVVGAVIILLIGSLFAKGMGGLLFKVLQKKNVDITLSKFLAGMTRTIILAFAIIIALGKFGITIAPFIAALGAAAFGATYAIQGPLSNYGAGLSIILGRPFVVGDAISVAGVSGVVQEVSLATTILLTEEGVRVTVPNKDIVGQILYNSKGSRLVPGVVGISYDSDPEKAIQVIRETLSRFQEVSSTPPPLIGIQTFGDSSVNIDFRYYVPAAKYFQISYAVNLAVYRALQAAKIPIPFPQRDVHIISEPSGARP
jgi:small conductance mechanosensitive channel